MAEKNNSVVGLRFPDIGRNCPGYFFAVGNHIPHNVPLENALYYFKLIKESGRR